jgi:hypothetical protein
MSAQQVFSLYYFECIFSEWSGITADELTGDGQCDHYLDNDNTIIYLDQRLNKKRKQIETNL